MSQLHTKVTWEGPIVIIGFGSIGKALLPLLHTHLTYNKALVTILDPDEKNKAVADEYQVKFVTKALTIDTYEDLLRGILSSSDKQALIINVAVNVSSKAIAEFAHAHDALYIDTVIDPWPGIYFNDQISNADQSNYALRESLLELKESFRGGPTVISCCGANPGMVSWLVKQALLNLAEDIGLKVDVPSSRNEWAKLMAMLEVKGIHIAERDSQKAPFLSFEDTFLNTWSVDGFLSEALQPAELGWGTHESALPTNGHTYTYGCRSSIYLDKKGGEVRIKTWTPTFGSHDAFLITHNEVISISDYFTLREGEKVIYRPTCNYAYRPIDPAVKGLTDVFFKNHTLPTNTHVLSESEIISGSDELGVLLYGHRKNAYWYGSQLTIEETRSLAPHQNATGLQVSSAVVAGILWAIKNPKEGLVEAEDLDFNECLSIQRPYLGKVAGYYTDWTPIRDASHTMTPTQVWQFSNIIVKESGFKRLLRRIKHLFILITGLLLKRAINYPFDYVVYPIVIAWLGSIIGGIILTVIALVVNVFIIRAYDWSKTDWFLIEKLKSIEKSTEQTLFVRLLKFFRKNKLLTFLILCLDDPVTVTLYFRKGNHLYNGMNSEDWRNYFISSIVANLYWVLGWSLVIETFKWVIEKI